jgi:hypothetical protein
MLRSQRQRTLPVTPMRNRAEDVVSTPNANRAGPEEISWDVAFTMLSREVAATVSACASALARRLEAGPLTCDIQTRQTPRGLSTFLSVIGPRGLVCIVDFTLVDGMAVSRHPGAALDVRLLDARGDVEASCSPVRASGARGFHNTGESIIAAAGLGLSVTSIHLIAMGHFDLVD